MSIEENIFEGLNEKEIEEVKKILSSVVETGSEEPIKNLLYTFYEEIPVDIETFIKDRRYLGNAWYDATGRFTCYPFWMEVYKKIFPDQLSTNINELILSGATGVGKSETAVTCLLYMLYRVLCLKDPYAYYKLKPTDEISFGFLNITLDLARGVAWQKCQETIQKSPWFLERGKLSGSKYIEWQPYKGVKLLYGSQPSHVLGKAAFCFFLDEVSFKKNKSVQEQQKYAMELYNAVNERMKSRFISQGGQNPTLIIMASSKRTESSFLETYIEDLKNKGLEKTLIIDKPRYEIRPSENYSGKKFAVAVGNKFLASELIPDGVDVDQYIKNGHKVIWVPVEEKKSFIQNIDEALTNVAGISSSNVVKFISGIAITDNIKESLRNAFSKDIITLGVRDNFQIKDFFNKNIVTEDLYSKPVFIHIDTSLSGDRTGISGVCINGTKHVDTGDEAQSTERELKFRHLFTVGIKAPKGDQISMEKNRQFIYYLKSIGWNIKGVSADGFQSADMMQILETKKIPNSKISVDIVKDKQPVAYNTFKAALTDKRIDLIYIKELVEELVDLERDNFTGKVDHPKSGSKDLADSVTGALYGASQYKSDYLFYYGEDMDITMELSGGIEDDKKQVVIDLVNSMKQQAAASMQSKPIPIKTNVQQPESTNFDEYIGFGDDGTIFIPETLSGDIIVF